MADTAESGGGEQDDISFLRTVRSRKMKILFLSEKKIQGRSLKKGRKNNTKRKKNY